MKHFILILFLALIFYEAAFAQVTEDKEDLLHTIKYLLNYVSESECIFIRNGREHKAEKASRHMKRKYEHFKEKIKTPEDFIRLAGTKSTVSGRLYIVRMKNGKEIPCAEWLNKALEEYRRSLIEFKEKDG